MKMDIMLNVKTVVDKQSNESKIRKINEQTNQFNKEPGRNEKKKIMDIVFNDFQ